MHTEGVGINGIHAVIYARDADRARAFFQDILEFSSVDAGHGWLIFALPPAELGIHPQEGEGTRHELYLMCDDIEATVVKLKSRGATFSKPITNQGWGLVTRLEIPGGGEIGLYQPRHPKAT